MSIIGSTMSPSTSTLEHLLNKWRKSNSNSKWLFIITDCFTVTIPGIFPLSQLPEKVTLVALMLLLVVRWWKVHSLHKNKTISVQQMLIVTGGTGPDGDLASTEVACVVKLTELWCFYFLCRWCGKVEQVVGARWTFIIAKFVDVSFQVGSLPTPRMGVAGASMDGVLHVSGGSDFTSVQSWS